MSKLQHHLITCLKNRMPALPQKLSSRICVLTRKEVFSRYRKGEKPISNSRLNLPGLWLSEVQVVDAVQVHVFRMPGKGRLPHAKIQVWGVHSLNGDPTLLLHQVQDGLQPANIPLIDVLQKKGRPGQLHHRVN